MTVLLLDSDPNRRKVVVEALERFGLALEIEAVAPGSEVMRRLSRDGYDVILDCGQPEKDRLAMLRSIQQRGQFTQVIVVTDEGSEEEARRAMQEGASDYIVRTEAYLTILPLVVEKAYQRCRLLTELQLRRENEPKPARPLPPQDKTIELPPNLEEWLEGIEKIAKSEEADVRPADETGDLKSDFIAIVSHELRIPLASIIGYVDLMLDEETGPLNEEQSQYLAVIERNAERLSRLINDILDITHIEAGRIDLAMAPLDVVEIAKETVVTMQPQAQAKGIEMIVSMAKGLPLIQGDPDRIRQVLVNVLGNAIKFTSQGGRVEISSRCLTAGEELPPPGPRLATASDWLLISVTDTGVGIAAEELDKIFEKFYQVGDLTDRSSEGSGLGLSIARGIVEAHGGKIWAQSDGENQGSTFTFALPVIEARPILETPAPTDSNTKAELTPTAVHHQRMAVDKAGLVAGQKGYGGGHLFGPGSAA